MLLGRTTLNVVIRHYSASERMTGKKALMDINSTVEEKMLFGEKIWQTTEKEKTLTSQFSLKKMCKSCLLLLGRWAWSLRRRGSRLPL